MSNKPLVSVCIGVYNRKEYIKETLESVFNQTYENIEIIVVDDASTDGVVEILQSYGERIRLIIREKNSGTAEMPRCDAVKAAQGKWCALIDSDDLWDKRKIEKQVDFMLAHPGISLSHCYVRIIDEAGENRGVRHENHLPSTGRVGRELLTHCFICTSSVIVEKEKWLAAVNPFTTKGFGTEWDVFLRIARDSSIGLLNEVLVSYRRSKSGISQQNWKRKPRDILAYARIRDEGLWRNFTSRKDFFGIMAEACVENSIYWRNLGFPDRSLFFCVKGMQWGLCNVALFSEFMKAVVGVIFSLASHRTPRLSGF